MGSDTFMTIYCRKGELHRVGKRLRVNADLTDGQACIQMACFAPCALYHSRACTVFHQPRHIPTSLVQTVHSESKFSSFSIYSCKLYCHLLKFILHHNTANFLENVNGVFYFVDWNKWILLIFININTINHSISWGSLETNQRPPDLPLHHCAFPQYYYVCYVRQSGLGKSLCTATYKIYCAFGVWWDDAIVLPDSAMGHPEQHPTELYFINTHQSVLSISGKTRIAPLHDLRVQSSWCPRFRYCIPKRSGPRIIILSSRGLRFRIL